jgi:hypothetical protein
VAGNTTFLKSEPTLAWLGQFAASDQPLAIDLLRAMTLVSSGQFVERLRAVILRQIEEGETPVGLYVERELGHRKGIPHRLFKETKTKIKRAIGGGPAIVQPTKAYDRSVGSEGLVAHLVSEICRENPKVAFLQPGPNLIRKYKIRRFILVTDYIGSGQRAWRYLQAAWRVRSVRSWWSARAAKGLSFEVVAYAASPSGRFAVEHHPCRPDIHVAISCPTIDTVFGNERRTAIKSLCFRYSAVKDRDEVLGYGSVGALIAFAHGIPNNAPLILHKRGSGWTPLFALRITSKTRSTFSKDDDEPDLIRERLVQMRQTTLAKGDWIGLAKPRTRLLLMVMAALSQRPRHNDAISSRTGLTHIDVKQALDRALSYGWIDGRNRLTDEGQAQLAHARKASKPISGLPPQPEEFYYPSSLRAPSGVSS